MTNGIARGSAPFALWWTLVLASCTTASEEKTAEPVPADPDVAETRLAASCRTEAGDRFGFDPQAASTLPVKASESGFLVYGSREDFTFRCLFDQQGNFQTVEETLP